MEAVVYIVPWQKRYQYCLTSTAFWGDAGRSVYLSAYFSKSCCIPSWKPFTKCIFKLTWYIFLNKSSTWFLKYPSSLLPRVIPSLKTSGGFWVNCWRKTDLSVRLMESFSPIRIGNVTYTVILELDYFPPIRIEDIVFKSIARAVFQCRKTKAKPIPNCELSKPQTVVKPEPN